MFLHTQFGLAQFIQCGHIEAIKLKSLLNHQNINQKLYEGRTPLHIAIICSQYDMIRYILLFKPDLTIVDNLGLRISDWIHYKKSPDIFKQVPQLLQHIPYDVVENKIQFKEYLTIWRAAQLSLERIKQICNSQNPFKKDQFGRTALHWAALTGNKETFLYLLERKFDPKKEDIFGFNCYHYILNNKNNLLQQHISFKNTNSFQICTNENIYEVIIIGCGAAGIGAGVTLARQGVPFLILEARHRIGGRILNTVINDVQIDLGACWVHSYSKKNPVCKQASKLGWKAKKSLFHSDGLLFSELSNGYTAKQQQECRLLGMKYFSIVQLKAQKSQHDISIEKAGQQFYNKQIMHLPKYKKALVDMIINMTQHYQATSVSDLSAKYYDQQVDCGGDFTPDHSYYTLLKAIADSAGLDKKINFGKQVIGINYENENQNNLCRLQCSDGSVYYARRAICSLPLGILKENKVSFSPKLPDSKIQIINKLGWGVMNKIIVSFNEPFWKQNPAWLRLACEERGKYPAIYNFSADGKSILCCFVTDNFALKISSWTDQQIIKDFMSTLQKTTKFKGIWPDAYVITRWDKDPFSTGSYTHFGVGSNIQSTQELRKNIQQKLWLVGQHCYGEHIGCAHGAFQTGIWAAQEIIGLLKNLQISPKNPKSQ